MEDRPRNVLFICSLPMRRLDTPSLRKELQDIGKAGVEHKA